MQNNKMLGTLISILIVILVVVFGISLFKEFKFNNNSNNTNDKENVLVNDNSEVEVLEISSKEIKNVVATFNIISMLDDENLLSLLFSGDDSVKVTSLTDNQKFYLALRHYMIINGKSNMSIDTCGEGDFYNLAKDKLKGLLFKDSSYLANINTIKQTRVGEYTYYVQSNEIKLCGSIFGFVGPLRNDSEIDVVSAYKKDGKLYINVKYVRYVLDNDKSTEDEFYYDTYDVYNNDNSKIIESFSEGMEPTFTPDYSKYGTYEFVFEINDNNYYFESINRKK